MSAAVKNEKLSEFHHAHHFENAKVQFEAGKLGIWLFLTTEILLFSALFCAYFVFRNWYMPDFIEAHHHLNKVMGGANTIVLICSSLTMALAVRAAQTNQTKFGTAMLMCTLLLAATFLVIKYFEYSSKYHHGLMPFLIQENGVVRDLFTAQFEHPHARVFFAVYFLLTGVHGLHILIGMGLITWILLRNRKGHFSSQYFAPVEGVGLYWHLVDLIWIFLFPLLYLVS